MTIARSKRLLLHLLIAVTGAVACSKASPVTPATVQSVALSGATALANKNQTSQLTLIAMISDGTAQNVTASSTWSSSSPAVAPVSSVGVATALTNGSTTITATYQGKSATLGVTVAMKATPAMTPFFSRQCSTIRAAMDVTMTEMSGNIGMTVTNITIKFYDTRHSMYDIEGFGASDIVAGAGTNHINAGDSRVFSWATAFAGHVDTTGWTAGVIMNVTDDAGNKSVLTQDSITQHDGC